VGLTTAVCLASKGFRVIGFDVDLGRLEAIARGETPFYEPGLEALLRHAMAEGLFRCVDDYYRAVMESQVSFVAVGTPSRRDGGVGLTYLIKTARMIGRALRAKDGWHLVAIRSTVPPRTTEEVIRPAVEGSSKKSYPKDFGMCVNPEFLREGSAVEDFMGPERVVIGVEDERSKDTMLQIYGWCTAPKIFTNLRTAEMIKYASNAFLASRISLSNELANICKALGVDWYQVAEAVGLDRRIGPHYLEAGLGFGGSCLPKDARALIALARRLKLEPEMLKATLRVNDKQPVRAVSLAEESLHNLKGKKVGILGLSFKPNTDDVRESRSIVVIEELLRRGASILAHDPKAMENMKKIFPNITYTGDPQRVIDESDAVIIATKWPEYEHLDYRDKIVIDGRRIMKAKAEARIYQGLCW